jgi:hypothetical protein
MVHSKKVFDKVLLLNYDSSETAARAFCRVQEHYESSSSQFKGKVFTLREFREWYTDQYGQWSYYKDWQGFNVPCKMFRPFILGSFDPLLPEEQELVEMVRYLDPEYYVIATGPDADEDVIEHEIAHALYATDHEYRTNVERIFDEFHNDVFSKVYGDDPPSLTPLMDKLKSMGYNDSVIHDECHAYMAASQGWLRKQDLRLPWELASRLRSNLLRRIEREQDKASK